MSLIIEWKGPFFIIPRPMALIPSDPKLLDMHGLYLWTVEHQEGYLVNYVGETGGSFWQRPLRAGITWSYGGRFNDKAKRSREMVDPKEFAQGRRVVIETPTREQFFADYPKYEAWIDEIYKSYRIFLAPSFVSESTRKSIESGIIRKLRSAGGDKIRNFIYNNKSIKQSPNPFQVTMQPGIHFHGLGATIIC